MVSTKKETILRALDELVGDDGQGIDRALSQMAAMQRDALAAIERVAKEAMANLRHEADATRAFAIQQVQWGTSIRIAAENPRAANVHATLLRAAARGQPGASAPNEASTDAGEASRRGEPDDDGYVVAPVDSRLMDERVLAETMGTGSEVSGVVPER